MKFSINEVIREAQHEVMRKMDALDEPPHATNANVRHRVIELLGALDALRILDNWDTEYSA